MSRSLTSRERAVLDRLLSAEFPGVAELRIQYGDVTASGAGMIIDLSTDESLPPAHVDQRNPVEAVVDGDGYDGGLILWVEEGRLSGLEYWWVTEERPDQFPPISAVGSPVVPAR